MPQYETILVERRGAVTLIRLNRPQALNALNSTVLRELIAAFAAFEADRDQGCAVLTGAGEKAFAAGAVAAEIAAMPRIALMVNKEMVNAAFETVLEQGLLFERRMWQILGQPKTRLKG